MSLELEMATDNGLDLAHETNENTILKIFENLGGAMLYFEFLNYLKSNGFPVVSCIRLISVKMQRNETSHSSLPKAIGTTEHNLSVLERLLQKNKIDYSAIETHPVFGSDHFEKLLAYLKRVA